MYLISRDYTMSVDGTNGNDQEEDQQTGGTNTDIGQFRFVLVP